MSKDSKLFKRLTLMSAMAGVLLVQGWLSSLPAQSMTDDDIPIAAEEPDELTAKSIEWIRLGIKSMPPSVTEILVEHHVNFKIIPNSDTWAGLAVAGSNRITMPERCHNRPVNINIGFTIRHEMGHILDFNSGMPSQSEEFAQALQDDVSKLTPAQYEKRRIWNGTKDKNKELFANIVSVSTKPRAVWTEEDRDEFNFLPKTFAFVVSRWPDLGSLRVKEQSEDLAVQKQATYIAEHPSSIDLFMARANEELKASKFQQAIADYSIVLSKQPKNLVALEGRARAYRALNKISAAVADEECYFKFSYVARQG